MSGSTPPPMKDSSDMDSLLTGTTLRVYRTIITTDRPLGPRELQKLLNLSTPSLALFHLEKLERSGLLSKTESGGYLPNKLYLKHYVRVRRMLIPRFVFQASVASFFFLGWIFVYFAPNFRMLLSQSSSTTPIVLLLFSYGLVVTAILASFFWFETLRVLRQEKI